jgi:hypothetical protein
LGVGLFENESSGAGRFPSEKLSFLWQNGPRRIDNPSINSFNPVSFYISLKGFPMAENFVVVSKVKKAVKEKGLRTGGDYIDALSKKVEDLVNASVAKVTAEGKKKTLGVEDLQ